MPSPAGCRAPIARRRRPRGETTAGPSARASGRCRAVRFRPMSRLPRRPRPSHLPGLSRRWRRAPCPPRRPVRFLRRPFPASGPGPATWIRAPAVPCRRHRFPARTRPIRWLGSRGPPARPAGCRVVPARCPAVCRRGRCPAVCRRGRARHRPHPATTAPTRARSFPARASAARDECCRTRPVRVFPAGPARSRHFRRRSPPRRCPARPRLPPVPAPVQALAPVPAPRQARSRERARSPEQAQSRARALPAAGLPAREGARVRPRAQVPACRRLPVRPRQDRRSPVARCTVA